MDLTQRDLSAVLDEFEFPGTDADVRAELERELDRVGSGALHARLAELDPAAAGTILPSNARRIVRALEVGQLTGQPYSARLPDHVYAFANVCQIGLSVPRDVLDRRIAERVDRMWAAGLVDEVRGRWVRVRQAIAKDAQAALKQREVAVWVNFDLVSWYGIVP